ncbi:MAG TPA: hypothetical protein VGI32_07255 [Steroidobacteraceae bacterium]|jgi:hypothetical protein
MQRVQIELRRVRRIFLATALVAINVSCDFSGDKDQATAYVDQYFNAAAGSNVETVLPFYSSKFFSVTPRGTWIETLKDVRARCGNPTSHQLKTWGVTNRIGTDAGSMAKLVYEVRYPRCHLTESFSVFRPDDGNRQIVGHFFKFDDAAPWPPSTAPAST